MEKSEFNIYLENKIDFNENNTNNVFISKIKNNNNSKNISSS